MQSIKSGLPKDQLLSGKEPVHQSVYEMLRARILFGDIAPGQQVTIQGLVAELGAGMTPVREAIRRLTSEGALDMQGNRRVLVPELTRACVEELEFVRKSLEPELARRASRYMTTATLSALEAEDDALNAAISQGNIPGYLKHNYEFHSILNAAAKSPILAATVDRMWLRFGPSLRVVCGRYGTLNLPDKHADLMDALKKQDESAAAYAMAEDVMQGMVQIRAALPEKPASQRFD